MKIIQKKSKKNKSKILVTINFLKEIKSNIKSINCFQSFIAIKRQTMLTKIIKRRRRTKKRKEKAIPKKANRIDL